MTQRIRQARREIVAEHDYDPKKLGAYFRKLDREEREEAKERAGGAIGKLRALVERLEEREQRAESEGMQELAEVFSGDRRRLHGAVERFAQGRRESEAATGDEKSTRVNVDVADSTYAAFRRRCKRERGAGERTEEAFGELRALLSRLAQVQRGQSEDAAGAEA